MVTDDCIGNYIFSIDPYSYDFNIALSLSSEHFSEEKVVMINNQDLSSREQKIHQSSSIDVVMDVELFPEDHHVFDLPYREPEDFSFFLTHQHFWVSMVS